VPELPEVETVARQLAPALTGRVLREVRILDPRLRPFDSRGLCGRTIEAVRRVGKQVGLYLGPSAGRRPEILAVHLRMTGRLLFVPAGVRGPARHRRAVLRVDGGRVVFCDPRRFGTLRRAASEREILGPAVDPLDRALTSRRLAALLAASHQQVKVWLLRQDRLVGLGNIYASEILFEARISPFARTDALDAAAVRRLHRALRAVLRRAIRCCGTTFSDFQDAHGMTGSYQALLRVYGREGEPCPRCGGAIARVVQQQRSTFHCPACTPDPGRHRHPDKRRAGGDPRLRKP